MEFLELVEKMVEMAYLALLDNNGRDAKMEFLVPWKMANKDQETQTIGSQ